MNWNVRTHARTRAHRSTAVLLFVNKKKSSSPYNGDHLPIALVMVTIYTNKCSIFVREQITEGNVCQNKRHTADLLLLEPLKYGENNVKHFMNMVL